MSDEIGNELPDDLFQALSDPGSQAGRAILATTVDAQGFAHPALLSYREVGARDRGTLRIVTYEGTRTTANLRENGRTTLIFVDERMMYYVKGTAAEVRSARGAPSFATMDVTVQQVLADAVGAGEAGSYITSGITFHDARA